MSLEVGSIVEGTVTGITNYGAFVRLPSGNTGLVHISEVADNFVEDIRHYLKEKDSVTVKILGMNNKGKFDLSLKQAAVSQPAAAPAVSKESSVDETEKKPFRREEKPVCKDNQIIPKRRGRSFEDMLGRFMKDSEERLLDLKRNTDSKRGRNKGR